MKFHVISEKIKECMNLDLLKKNYLRDLKTLWGLTKQQKSEPSCQVRSTPVKGKSYKILSSDLSFCIRYAENEIKRAGTLNYIVTCDDMIVFPRGLWGESFEEMRQEKHNWNEFIQEGNES